MTDDSFWSEYGQSFCGPSAMDALLQEDTLEDGGNSQAVRELFYPKEEPEFPAGMRVKFKTTLDSLLSYSDPPTPNLEGTVVLVKSGSGKNTMDGKHVFVHWDDGKFRPTLKKHLRLSSQKKQAKGVAFRIANLSSLAQTFRSASNGDELVHKATRDLWSFHQGNDGQYVIERLFNNDGSPIKV